ncbi:hypothetical protein BJ958_004286 [Nocardioides kongjuensis]|uniref:Uncharacterized protein n=1 Tax=Nocardioides kongjuensis TaxID=349522 RepID=A0A852RV43_9ACTN|nr:hypothetical protein [Nocardioides kongjuensis]
MTYRLPTAAATAGEPEGGAAGGSWKIVRSLWSLTRASGVARALRAADGGREVDDALAPRGGVWLCGCERPRQKLGMDKCLPRPGPVRHCNGERRAELGAELEGDHAGIEGKGAVCCASVINDRQGPANGFGEPADAGDRGSKIIASAEFRSGSRKKLRSGSRTRGAIGGDGDAEVGKTEAEHDAIRNRRPSCRKTVDQPRVPTVGDVGPGPHPALRRGVRLVRVWEGGGPGEHYIGQMAQGDGQGSAACLVEGPFAQARRLGVPGHQVGSSRLIGGLPPSALWRRSVL